MGLILCLTFYTGVDFRFSELSFNGSESSREVCATVLSIGLALIDIDLRITPMTLTEYTALRRSETNLPLIGSNLDPAECKLMQLYSDSYYV